ncbi:peptidyl-prolyl cis-trans isomerase [Metabacillus sediminilitoris]|uniref:peptidylprolyl isomerase n=1 Tax=Metabacillus sediminilitoris TaxID=2567941 RepID=A0A4S4BM09_9BACI|nr:peptidyl-prolyl cis-trans isomerase [Metabacillus sediminilitoris]QGQ43951.1 peptidylprolyl isomerase [Metabacillus sediminilitoris]THF75824.1 peptidylprolyl isomerase [Metabacillus sediminilitoris]
MSSKTLWSIIFGLVIINCLTVGFFFSKEQGAVPISSNGEMTETIATIGEETITREQWMAELESRFGKDTLRELVNIKVVEELAKKYDITVSDDVIERELAVYKSMYNPLDEEQAGNEEDWRQQIRYSILLEELLTRDVTIPEKEMKVFYENNQDLYNIAESFHLSQIIVKTEAEAMELLKELDGGSSFEALALEKSIDEFTANSGGDIGFVSKENEYVPTSYIEAAKQLSKGEWSEPIKVDNGYAVITLHEKLEGQTYSYEEVKEQIRRQIALEQMEGSVTVEPLWDEIGVSWFYGSNTEK